MSLACTLGIKPATFLSLGRRVLDACEGIKFGGETVTSSSRQVANCSVAVTDTTADGNALNLTLKHIVCLVFFYPHPGIVRNTIQMI